MERQRGYTLVPLELYWVKGRAKLQIGVAKGKKQYDKRETEKERDWQRDKQRLAQNAALAPVLSAPSQLKSRGVLQCYLHWGRPDSTWVCEPSRAYRGAVPSLITLQIIVANDDNFAVQLAA